MIILKTDEMINGMHESGKLLASVHRELRKRVVPGVTTLELDEFVENYLKAHGATPEQKGYEGFPFSICASVNDEICHGFPSDGKLKEGDIITIDMVVNLNGYLSDSAWSYGVGEISEEKQKLLDVTKESLYRAISVVNENARLGDIGHAIQSYVEPLGYSVVREFVGHGIGKDMHEDPQVLHYGKPGRGQRLSRGMVFTIEPMINIGTHRLKIDSNGWTARTLDGLMSAQYEHTIAINSKGEVLVLTEQDE